MHLKTMAENFVTLDTKTYESLQQELIALRQQVGHLQQTNSQQAADIQELNQALDEQLQEQTTEIAKVERVLQGEMRELELAFYDRQPDNIGLEIQAARLKHVATHLPGVIFQFTSRDGVWRVDYISEGIWELAGITATDMMQDLDLDLFIERLHPDDLKDFTASVVEAVENSTTWHYEGRLIKPDGEICWWQGDSTPIKNESGEMVFCGLLLDINKRKHAEEALRQLNEELEVRVEAQTAAYQQAEAERDRFFNLSVDMLCIASFDGHFKRVNPAFEVALGYTAEELIAQPFLDFVHPEDREATIAESAKIGQGASSIFFDNRYRCKDGSYKWLSWNSVPFTQEREIYAIARDITERKQAAELLNNQRRRLSLLIEQSPLAVIEWNANLEVVAWNPAAADIFGYGEEEAIGRHAAELIIPNDAREKLAPSIAQLLSASGGTCISENLTKDGRRITCEWHNKPLTDTNGEVIGAVSVAQDISDRKVAERQLLETKNLYQQILDAIPDLILCKGPQSRIVYGNKAFRDYYRMTQAQLQDLIDAPFAKPDYTEQYIKDDACVFNTGHTLIVEELAVRYDGQERLFSTIKAPIFNSQGAIVQTVGVSRDITERKQAEIQLRQQAQNLENTLHELQRTQTQLVQSEKMSSLGQLVAGVAHEINNPVNFIYGNLVHANQYAHSLLSVIQTYQQCYPNPVFEVQEAIEEADLEFLFEDLPKLLKSMQVGAQRIREIIASLRNFSRIDEAERKPVDIHEGIDSTLMILQNRLKARSDYPGIKVVKDYGNLPQVECYPGQLNQVFMNILVNAIDALEDRDKTRTLQEMKQNPSSIRIATEWIELEQQVRIKIGDNGPGISEAVKNRIFDPFFTTKALGKGTGLGMSISHQIVTEKHNGTLECISSIGAGAEFVIQLPVSLSHQTELKNPPVGRGNGE